MSEKRKPWHHRLSQEEINTLPGQELKAKRTRSSKTYSLGNGLYQSVIYPDAVHYRNEKGEWEDIDHTMINEGDALCDHSGDLAVKLAPGGCVTLTKGEHRLSWQIAGAASVEAAAENAKVTIFRHNENRRIENKAVYANLFPGVDFICDLKPNRFKDTLVFKDAAALRPVEFLLHAEGLTLRQSPSGAVVAMCGDQTIFRLPAPAVANENGEVIPGSAHAVLTQVSNSDWRWVCEVDSALAMTASYPIFLDPVVETQQADTGLSMAYTSTKKPTTNYAANGYSTLLAYNDYSLGKVCSYLQFAQSALPEIDSSYYVTAATLSMYTVDPAPTMSTAVYLKEVESPWTQSAITYNTRPQVADKAVEFSLAPTAYGMKLDFNIANLVRKWYNGENHGVMLETTAGSIVALGAVGASNRKPYLTITYVSLAGLENYLVQDSIGCGRAGTAHIGLFNGNLVFSHQETAMNGNLMPVSISRYYNSCYRDVNPFGVGYGWKLSTQQTLHKETLGSTIYYVYMDGDGTRHHFKQESGEWKDLSGLEYTLSLDTSANTATITNKGDSKMVFALPTMEFNGNYANVGMLQSITDACGNTATFMHDANRVFLSATDGAIRPTNGVITDGELCSITAPGMPAVGYKYENGYLTEITHVDGVKSMYEYNTAGLLVSVKVRYGNDNDHQTMKLYYHETAPYRVHEVHLLTAAGNVYTGRRYTYGNCCTAVTELYPDANGSLVEGKSLHYHFNDAGNLVSVNDELGYGRFLGYDDTAAPLNHPTFVSKMQRAVTNHLKNHHFITVNNDWTIDKMDSTGEGGYNSDAYYIGGRSYFLKKTSASGRISTYQTVALVKGKPYTFSCQYKTLNAAKAQLRLEWQNSAGEAQYAESPAFASTTRWNRTHVSFTLPEDAASNNVTVRIMAAGGIGTVWADAAQLEDGLVPNRYNLLENGTFYMNDSGRPMYWTTGYQTDTEDIDGVTTEIAPGRPAELTGNVVRLYGKPGMTKVIDQTVPSIGNAGDTFVAGGWSWSNCRPRNDACNSRYEMQILARPYVASGVAQFQTVGRVQWSEEWSGWQFAAIPVVIPFRYTDIYVKLMYQNNLNEAQFSNLFLHKEEFGKTFAYDDKGNMTSVKNLAALESDAEYDDFNNLTSYCQPGRSEPYTLDWGSTDEDKKKHLLRSTTSPLGIVHRMKYDAEGENAASTKGLPVETSVENVAGTMKIVSKAEYTENKNYVHRQIDARNKTVTTVTDTNRGTVTSVTDPKNQTVRYAYDDLNRVTEVETAVVTEDETLVYRNEYTYEEDKLTGVCHNTSNNANDDVKYTFEYDAQDRRTAVKVGNQLLSRNVYNDTAGDRYGTLERMEYGNGHVVRNSYDEFKRVVGVQYDDDETDRYSYEYDANGQVARVTNHELNRTVLSEHDSCSRPMRVTHMEGDAHVYTGEVTYDERSNLASFEEQVGTARTSYTTTFAYDEENRPTLLKYGSDTNKVAYAYDGLGRTATRTVTVGGKAYTSSYGYLPGGYVISEDTPSPTSTGLILSIAQTGGTFVYSYDDNGNITRVMQDGKYTYYAYDTLGQLIRVDDQNDTTSGSTGTTWVYTYDQGGNILSKKRYAYTASEVEIIDTTPVLETMAFTYTNADWKDQLTTVNGTPITYDNIGNPLNDGTWQYEWVNGRQLTRMHNVDTNASFVYNENGLRVQKTVNGVVTDYTLHGKNIVHMTQGSNELHFFYDASNKPAIVEFNGSKYAYVHNLQGDIVAILDSNGAAVVQYKYDAWGKQISKTGSMASTLGTLQPFRYRGYVYDEETGLYYLRSRYYNPACCHFINMDAILLNGLLVSNQQAYCCNNPVLHSDSNGRDFLDDAWNGLCSFGQFLLDAVNESQRIKMENAQAEHKAWHDAGKAVNNAINVCWNWGKAQLSALKKKADDMSNDISQVASDLYASFSDFASYYGNTIYEQQIDSAITTTESIWQMRDLLSSFSEDVEVGSIFGRSITHVIIKEKGTETLWYGVLARKAAKSLSWIGYFTDFCTVYVWMVDTLAPERIPAE